MKHSPPLETLDFQDFQDRLVSHYAQMALNPATLDYARQRVLKMQQEPSGLWDGLGILVKQRIEELKGVKNEPVSDN
jgi:hypothetical protein